MSTIYQIIAYAILTGLFIAFIVLLLNKTIRYDLRDFCDKYKISLIAKMLDCDFCLSFWLSLAFCIAISITSSDYLFLFIPFFSTPITRFML